MFILWFRRRKRILTVLLLLLLVIISFQTVFYFSYGEVIEAYNQHNLHEIKEVRGATYLLLKGDVSPNI